MMLLLDDLTGGGMTAHHISDEIGRFGLRRFQVNDGASASSDQQISSRRDNNSRLHFNDHITAVRRHGSYDADSFQTLRFCMRDSLFMSEKRKRKRKMRQEAP